MTKFNYKDINNCKHHVEDLLRDLATNLIIAQMDYKTGPDDPDHCLECQDLADKLLDYSEHVYEIDDTVTDLRDLIITPCLNRINKWRATNSCNSHWTLENQQIIRKLNRIYLMLA